MGYLSNMKSTTMTLQDIITIESAAYPEDFVMMDDYESWEDVADYCEVEVENLIVIGEPGWWYGLIAVHEEKTAEFVDLVKMPGSNKIPKLYILKKLREFGIKYIYADLRECTSYKVLKRLPLFVLGIHIRHEKRYFDEGFGEWMYELKVEI
jgi:hypothetical protein